jgi:hypothetical protein
MSESELKGETLVRAALAHIVGRPKDHYQGAWARAVGEDYQGGGFDPTQYGKSDPNVCHTAYCLAGHMAVLQGYRELHPAEIMAQPWGAWLINPRTKESMWVNAGAYRVLVQSGEWESVEEVMSRELPTWADADELFSATNSIEDLEDAVRGCYGDDTARG